jgi:glycosyltransferase involved in cell wall biosynthesis
MKIALVAERDPRSDDQIRTRELARTLTAAGHKITMHEAGGTLTAVTGDAGQLRSRWSKDRPDVVHAMRWISGLAALAASRELGLPVVQTFASLGVAELRHKIDASAERIRLEPAIGRAASAVLAANSGEAADLAKLGVPRRHIKVIPCGVDTDHFAPEGPAAARDSRPRLLTVGDNASTAALNTLLHALTRVPEAELLVVGGPPRGVDKLADTLSIGDRVHLIGVVGEQDLPPLLRSADLYVNTAEYEPTGMISLDAMACGTPVITPVRDGTDAVADAVVDGTNGMLVQPGRPALLAHRIRQLLAHPMMLEAYSVAATDRVRSRYSWDRIAKETVAVYETAAAA